MKYFLAILLFGMIYGCLTISSTDVIIIRDCNVSLEGTIPPK
jgi:hypothetical protein